MEQFRTIPTLLLCPSAEKSITAAGLFQKNPQLEPSFILEHISWLLTNADKASFLTTSYAKKEKLQEKWLCTQHHRSFHLLVAPSKHIASN